MPEMKEVYYDLYCPNCEHKDLSEQDEPCNQCMCNSVQEDSHKPEFYKGEPLVWKKERKK